MPIESILLSGQRVRWARSKTPETPLHSELSASDYRDERSQIEGKPSGTCDMTLTDPFGNRLTFTKMIST